MLQFEEDHFSSNFDVRKGKIEHTWFKGGRTNIAYNCLDRHIKEGRGSTTCFLWEGNEPKDCRSMTYKEVLDEVCRVVGFYHVYEPSMSLRLENHSNENRHHSQVSEVIILLFASLFMPSAW